MRLRIDQLPDQSFAGFQAASDAIGASFASASERERHDAQVARFQAQVEADQQEARTRALRAQAEGAALESTLAGMGLEAGTEAPEDPIQQRIETTRMVARRFLEAGDTAGARRFVQAQREEIHGMVQAQGFERNQTAIQDLVQDGLVPEEQARALLELNQQLSERGGNPDQVASRLVAVSEAAGRQRARQAEWEETETEVSQLINSTRNPELKRQMRAKWAETQRDSLRRRMAPDDFVEDLREMYAQDFTGEPDRRMEGVFSSNQGSTGGRLAELREMGASPEMLAHSRRKEAERAERLGRGRTRKVVDFDKAPMDVRGALRGQLLDMVRETQGDPAELQAQLAALIESSGIRPESIPEDFVSDILEALDDPGV